jgi:hypothetical protein
LDGGSADASDDDCCNNIVHRCAFVLNVEVVLAKGWYRLLIGKLAIDKADVTVQKAEVAIRNGILRKTLVRSLGDFMW